jgi:hypothetical protein
MDLVERLLSPQWMTDLNGRPLREHMAPAELQRGVPMALKTCPYRGSRHKHERPMNVSALSDMMGNWPDVLEAIAFCRELYVRGRPKGPWTFLDMWRVGTWCEALPVYLARRRVDPVPLDGIPPFAAGLFKVVFGVNSTFFKMARRAFVDGADSIVAPTDVDRLLAFIEEDKALIGPQQVCAGPNPQIRTSLEVLAHGASAIPQNVRRGLFVGDEVMVGPTGQQRVTGRLVAVESAGCEIAGVGFIEPGTAIDIAFAGAEAEGVVLRVDGDSIAVMWVRAPSDEVLHKTAAGRSANYLLKESKVAMLVPDQSGFARFAYAYMNSRVVFQTHHFVQEILFFDLERALVETIPEFVAIRGEPAVEIGMLADLDSNTREQALAAAVLPWLSPSIDTVDPELPRLFGELFKALDGDERDPLDPVDDHWLREVLKTSTRLAPARERIIAVTRRYLGTERVCRKIARCLKALLTESLGFDVGNSSSLWGATGDEYWRRSDDRFHAVIGALLQNDLPAV